MTGKRSSASGKTNYQVRWRLLPRGKWTDWQYCDRETFNIGSDEGLEVRRTPDDERKTSAPLRAKTCGR